MIPIPKILLPILRRDLNLLHQKYDSIWVEIKTSKNKIETSIVFNTSYNPIESNKIEFVAELALSVGFAKSCSSNIVLRDDYNAN